MDSESFCAHQATRTIQEDTRVQTMVSEEEYAH